MPKTQTALIFVAALAAAALAGPPDKETVAALVRAKLSGSGDAAPTNIAADNFVDGDAPGRLLAAVHVRWEYYDEVYAALFVRGDGGWELPSLDDAVSYLPETGGDAGTITKVRDGPRPYYAFTCTEASYGTGLGTESDYYRVYAVADGALAKVFDGAARELEVVYSRWYGGDDSTAWQDGGTYETLTDYLFQDLDRDGAAEIWATTRARRGEGESVSYVRSELYAVGADGVFAPAPMESFRAALEAEDTWEANLLLGERALKDAGDVTRALKYYERAVAIWPAVGGVDEKVEVLRRLAGDPAEPVKLFFADDLQGVLDKYPKTAAAAEATVIVGDFRELLAFLKTHPQHPRWLEAYEGAVVEAVYSDYNDPANEPTIAELNTLKKYLPRFVDGTPDGTARAELLTRLADCYYHAGDLKTARGFYERSLAADAASVFADYDNSRLGDCAAAAGDAEAAIGAYMDALGADGWWSGAAGDELLAYASVRVDGAEQNFLDYWNDEAGTSNFNVAAGELDGDGRADLVVVATAEDEDGNRADRCFYFLRRPGDGFVGERLATGAVFWYPEVANPFPGDGAGVLAFGETVETPAGRDVYRRYFRYDGREMKKVAEVLTERYEAAADRHLTAEATLAAGPPPRIVVNGTVKEGGVETPFYEEHVWDEDDFAFTRQQLSEGGAR